MSERQDYASTDLKRRPFHSAMVLASITVVVAFTVFLFLFAAVLLNLTGYITSTSMLSVLGVFFEGFVWATLIFVLILSTVVVSSTISLEMISRRRDIGLMKSIGAEIDVIYDHFIAQAVILLLGGLVFGVALGTLLYLLGMTWLSFALPGLEFTFEYPVLQVGLLVLLIAGSGYYAAQRPVYQVVNETPMSAINPELGTRIRRQGYLDTFGLPFRIAMKSSGRRVKGFRRTVLSLFLCITLASLLWVGGTVVETTTDAYIVRSMGSNVIAVGDSEVLATYYGACLLTGTPLDGTFDFINASYMIPEGLATEMNSLLGVVSVDSRLIEYENVVEDPAIIWNSVLGEYQQVGSNRASSALIVGLDWAATASDWYFDGNRVENNQEVWIGGRMANTMYEDPLVEGLALRGAVFSIKAVAFDVSNGGMMAIMSLDRMQELWGVSGTNLLLVQLDLYTADRIEAVEQLAAAYGLSTLLQEEVVNQNMQTVRGVWYLLQPLPIIAMVGAFLSLAEYLLVSVSQRFRDYVVMRMVGAKPRFLAETVIAEGLDVALKAGVPAILFAAILSIYLLVPEAAVPSVLFLPTAFLAMIGALVGVVVLSSLPVYAIFMGRSDLRVSEFSV